MLKIDRIKELVQELNKASKEYYNGRKSHMNDKQWDLGFDELKNLELETGFVLPLSPTINVGYEVVNELEKIQHRTRMLSLDKTKEISQLKKFLGNRDGILSWKEDGNTIVLHYNNGILVNAVTRGGGDIGSKILHNAKVFKAGIPLKINYEGNLVIRGEGMISKSDFNIINVNDEYANPRNLSSGSIMQLDSKIAKERCLQFKAFGIVECDNTFSRYSQQLEWLEHLGFNTVEYLYVNKDNIENSVLAFKDQIDKYDFATDGLVLMHEDLVFGKSLGITTHHENNAIAFKWQDSTVETTLRDIQFQVGRTGVLTPVANFDEVEIEGSMVSKASLHNISILRTLELGVGDTISVYKANMIIPQLDDNLTRSNTFKLPTECPECHGVVELTKTKEAEVLKCTNPNCRAKLVQKISHYCGKDAMNIMGVSDAIIESLIEKGFLNSVTDLYKLEQYKSQIVKMEGFGLKSYNKIIEAVSKSKKTKMSNLLFGLGIPNIGKGTAKDISNYFEGSIDLFMDAIGSWFDFSSIKDVGEITNRSIYDWFSEGDNNINTISELMNILELEKTEVKNISEIKENPFLGKKLYCTGTFANYKKEQLKSILEGLGAEFSSGYAKSLDFLVVGSLKGSSKQAKAEKDGVVVLTEEQFEEMIKEI